MTTFAENLRIYREAMKLSRKEIAALLSISIQAYGHYENGEREPKLEMLVKIATLLRVSVDDLLGYKVDTYEHYKDDDTRNTIVSVKIVTLLKESGIEPMDAIICLHGIEASMLKVIRDMCNEDESEDDDE